MSKITQPDDAPLACQPNRWSVYLMLAGCMVLWGGTWPVGRVVARSVAPANAALLRFVMASASLVLLCLKTGGPRALRVRPRLLPQLVLLGATGIFGYSFLFFSGLRTITAGRAALIVGCIPMCISLCSSLIAWKRLPMLAVVGILLSLAGVAVVVGNGNPLALLRGGVQPGDLMILGCVGCWTAYSLLARPVMRELSPLVAVTWSCLFGTAMLLPPALACGLAQDIAATSLWGWASLAYLGVLATSFGYYWYYHAIHHIGTGMPRFSDPVVMREPLPYRSFCCPAA